MQKLVFYLGPHRFCSLSMESIYTCLTQNSPKKEGGGGEGEEEKEEEGEEEKEQ